jgi:hypothetical protein
MTVTGERGHVFWCAQTVRPAAACTCTSDLIICVCGHDQAIHIDTTDRCRFCSCFRFERGRETVRVERVLVIDPVTRKRQIL